MIVAVNWATQDRFLRLQFVIFRCQKCVKKGYKWQKNFTLRVLKSVLDRSVFHYSCHSDLSRWTLVQVCIIIQCFDATIQSYSRWHFFSNFVVETPSKTTTTLRQKPFAVLRLRFEICKIKMLPRTSKNSCVEKQCYKNPSFIFCFPGTFLVPRWWKWQNFWTRKTFFWCF